MGVSNMMDKNQPSQSKYMYVNLEELVPKDHLLREVIDKIDFSFIYDKVENMYSHRGRRSVDPVKLIKMLLIGYFFGIPSERQLEEQVRVNLAYRWFLNIDLDEPVPDHSTISQNRRRRFKGTNVFQEIFDEIIKLCIAEGIVTGEIIVTDSTHIKANASNKRKEVVTVECTPSEYLGILEKEAEALQEKINKEKGYKGKKRGKEPNTAPKTKQIVRSKTDPESGYLNRPEKPKGFHYLDHMSIDAKHGIITDVYVTPGNVDDSEPYIDRLKSQQERLGLNIRKVGADKGYDYMNVHYGLDKLGIEGYIPGFARLSKTESFTIDKFAYNRNKDVYICPEGKFLYLSHIKQKKTKVYAARTRECKACLLKEQCLSKSDRRKSVTRPFHQDYADKTHTRQGSVEYTRIRKLRRMWCEGTNGILKENHNLSKARRRGIANVLEQCLLSALVINIKRYIKAIKQRELRKKHTCISNKIRTIMRKWLGKLVPSHFCQQAP
ncbi:IS1182 family transposase [Phosphitispora sp. TUW77]